MRPSATCQRFAFGLNQVRCDDQLNCLDRRNCRNRPACVARDGQRHILTGGRGACARWLADGDWAEC